MYFQHASHMESINSRSIHQNMIEFWNTYDIELCSPKSWHRSVTLCSQKIQWFTSIVLENSSQCELSIRIAILRIHFFDYAKNLRPFWRPCAFDALVHLTINSIRRTSITHTVLTTNKRLRALTNEILHSLLEIFSAIHSDRNSVLSKWWNCASKIAMTGSFASDAIPNLGLTNIESPFINHTVKFKIRFSY